MRPVAYVIKALGECSLLALGQGLRLGEPHAQWGAACCFGNEMLLHLATRYATATLGKLAAAFRALRATF